MVTCPYCQQPVEPKALSCPYCRTELKAYGHPGMPLHRALDDSYLCHSCSYHADDSCTYPQRPFAKTCMLYTARTAQPNHQTHYQPMRSLNQWISRHSRLLALIGLVIISIIFALQ
ncbi:MAG: zinc ribbon domain-containing protein [Cyanobacteria bacterium]|nr:zinc ribbon domain-containing protein [Cyanobacteriota bacterium]MDW8202790.1 zinc ribbon domain-containing protein [Cyanobacteriota bacterium SKYGB_h_bin112]